MTPNTKAHFAVLGTNLFFAGNYSLVKFISPSLGGPFSMNVLRVGISLFLFWLIWMFSRPEEKLHREDLGRFVLCGLTGVALNQMFFVKGLTMTSTIHASLLILATPIVVTVFALWVLKEPFSFYKAAGLALGIGGSVLLIMQKESSQTGSNYLLGDLFILINSVTYAVYFILVKPLMDRYTPMQVVRWIFTFGFVMILPFAWKETTEIRWNEFHSEHIAALLFVTIAGSFLAYFFNAIAIQRLGAGITGTYIYTQPVFAVLIATLALHEAFTAQKLVAALLIFCGVYLVSFRKSKS